MNSNFESFINIPFEKSLVKIHSYSKINKQVVFILLGNYYSFFWINIHLKEFIWMEKKLNGIK